jgi:hypothetical protein
MLGVCASEANLACGVQQLEIMVGVEGTEWISIIDHCQMRVPVERG